MDEQKKKSAYRSACLETHALKVEHPTVALCAQDVACKRSGNTSYVCWNLLGKHIMTIVGRKKGRIFMLLAFCLSF